MGMMICIKLLAVAHSVGYVIIHFLQCKLPKISSVTELWIRVFCDVQDFNGSLTERFFYALVTAKELKTRLHHECCHLNQCDSLQTILHFHYLNTSGCTTY